MGSNTGTNITTANCNIIISDGVGTPRLTFDSVGNSYFNGSSLYASNSTVGQVLIGGDSNGSIEIGQIGRETSGTPFIDFHSAAGSLDYDVRLIASGGSTSTGGAGTLNIVAANLTQNSQVILTTATIGNYSLSLSGGILSGRLIVPAGTTGGIAFPNDAFGGSGDTANITLTTSTGEATRMTFTMTNDADDLFSFVAPSDNGMLMNGNVVLHAGNYNIYAPTKTGTGASGTWNITASTATYATSFNTSTLVANSVYAVSAGNVTTAANATTALKVENTVTGTNAVNLVYGNMATNDQFRITIGGTAVDSGFAEIATSDNGNEPIYVRQYTGVFSTLTNSAALLDSNGNTTFPKIIAAGTQVQATATGNDFNTSSFHAFGNGTTNTIFPGIGFHQPNMYASSIQLRAAADFRFYAQGATSYADITCKILNGTATSAQYADLAENYVADAKYDLGTVLIFGGTHEISIATESHSPAIAGIVSTNPAHLMNAECKGEFIVAVALQGRVPCKVTGKIRKGDRLVASDIAGYATVMDKTLYEPGCIIGKALEDFEGDTGVIEVVVGRV